MDKFTVHKGLAAPMDRENVDTDAIIPKQFLKSIHRTDGVLWLHIGSLQYRQRRWAGCAKGWLSH